MKATPEYLARIRESRKPKKKKPHHKHAPQARDNAKSPWRKS